MIEAGKRKAASDSARPLASASDRTTESRLDPLTGQWTVFAPHREGRPEEFVDHKDELNARVECPFCGGNEESTPPAVWSGRVCDDDESASKVLDEVSAGSTDPCADDWAVRVVPNKYPAVRTAGSGEAAFTDAARHVSNLFPWSPTRGGHEVIIESRNHVQSISQLDVAELRLVFQAFRDRMLHWRQQREVAYVSVFKNVGAKAGASLSHTHSQLIATDFVPPEVATTVARMTRHRAASGCCLQCDLIRAEIKARQRVIWQDDELVAFCPFASRLPMLIRITTLDHQPCYEDLDDRRIDSVARLVGRAVAWLETLRGGTAYNLCLHTRPPGADDRPDSFHWSIDLFPRLTQVAGFEWSGGCMINPVLPEQAAARFRACALSEDPRVML